MSQYAEEQGVGVEARIDRANAAYDSGNTLCQAKRYAEAIEKYSEAIGEFPVFVEAHDNRALTLMDLGRFREAADGFAESLRVESDNPVALLSLGECHLELGDLDDAVRIFRECVSRWPDRPHHREFLARAEALRDRPAGKPWWWPW